MKISTKDILFVVLQFLIFIAYAFEVDSMKILFPEIIFWLGVILFVIGSFITLTGALQLNIHLSPFPSPLPGSKLIENGVYKISRHPIYTGIILAFFGYAFISDSGYRIIITGFLWLLFYYKSVYEETQLLDKFPKYSAYKSRTGRFLPWL